MFLALIRPLPVFLRKKSLVRLPVDVSTGYEPVFALHDRDGWQNLRHVLSPVLVEVGDDRVAFRLPLIRNSAGRPQDFWHARTAVDVALVGQSQ
jgi:hypothetical protein